jgi:diguanylate cyclase (GGDEF)-like protein
MGRAQRSGEPFSLVLFDLDGFKALNDSRGHAAGDAALRLVAERARACMRSSDTLGRMGGDEFLAVLPNTTAEGATQVAEKLRAALAQPYELPGAPAQMSTSIGVSAFPMHGLDVEALLRAGGQEPRARGKHRAAARARGGLALSG